MKNKLYMLLGAMIFILIIGAIIIGMTNKEEEPEVTEAEDKLQIVTTFYPVYMIGLNITEGIEGIEVKSLTDLDTGCLHDYVLTTEDMRIISEADIMVINGGGMESFLEDIRTNYPELTIVDASEAIEMLPTMEGHTHSHADVHADESEDEHAEEGVGTEGEHSHGEWNAHVWLDPQLYIQQITQVTKSLEDYMKAEGSFEASVLEELNNNKDRYIEKVTKLDQQINELAMAISKDSASNREAVIFHDAFAYLANRVGIIVAHTVPLDSDTALSAGDIGEIIDEVETGNIRYLFTEEQYSDSIASQIASETEASVYIIDSAVTGDGSRDSYLTSMQKNIETLKKLVK